MPLSASRLEALFADNSLWGLLLANLVTIVLAVLQGWDLLLVMWVYWCQSVIIGIFNFWRMLTLKKFTTKGLKMNGSPVAATDSTRRQVSFFFLFHYGFFHLVYLIFLLAGSTEGERPDFFSPGPLLMVLLFFINHAWSFFSNRKREAEAVPNIGTLMFLPYARIIPMHLTLVLGGVLISGRFWLVLFLALKTGADLIAHVAEHARLRRTSTSEKSSFD
ncbi:DUF6498-containing protein [Thiolapillus brandeum]|uniref:Uncharacterized protein n=1 Tax=Thiolapillus brandeum TaxID=1076588 RepID=A0A7U6GGH0_9GAMM|nr:DUF6498-containing protein [Thiolapillus brandeum]BAO43139.1 hypothetical protein TBH_C0191 [Thiolapillus brandeum]